MRGLGLGLSAVVLCGARRVLLAEARKKHVPTMPFGTSVFANDFGPKLAASDCNRTSLSVMRSTHLRRAAQHIHGCRNTNGRKMECRVNAVQAMLRSREKRGFRLSSCSSALEPSYEILSTGFAGQPRKKTCRPNTDAKTPPPVIHSPVFPVNLQAQHPLDFFGSKRRCGSLAPLRCRCSLSAFEARRRIRIDYAARCCTTWGRTYISSGRSQATL